MKTIKLLIITTFVILAGQLQAQDGYTYSLVDNGSYSYSVAAIPNASTSNFATSAQSYGFTIIVPDGVTLSSTTSIGGAANYTLIDGTNVALPSIDGYLITETFGGPVTLPAPSLATNSTMVTFQVNGSPTTGSMYILANNSALATSINPLKSFMQADMIDNGSAAFTNVIDPNTSGLTTPFSITFAGGISYDAASYCADAPDPTPTISGGTGGTFSSGAGLIINSTTGEIDLSASTPGNYTVSYSADGGSTTSVTIDALEDASFNYDAAAYCVSDSNPTPTISGASGGTFSSTAGLTINGTSGVIDISNSTPGNYTITYLTAGTCPNSATVSVTINELDDASFSYDSATYCVDEMNPIPTITGLTGGSFSGDIGLALNGATGGIGVSASTPGTYTITYTTAGNCPNTSTTTVTVNALSDASFSYDAASYCIEEADAVATITGLAGGVFSSLQNGLSFNSSTGAIDVSASTPGTYSIIYTSGGDCPNSSSVDITINVCAGTECTNPISVNPIACGATVNFISSTVNGTPSTAQVCGTSIGTGGANWYTFTGDGANYIVSTTNAGTNFDTKLWVYEGSCGALVCVGGNDDIAPGNLDSAVPFTSTLGTEYFIVVGGFAGNEGNYELSISKVLDDASFTYPLSTYCIADIDPTPTITGLAGGTFSSTAGLVFDSGAGTIDVSASTPGTYLMTYTTTGFCSNTDTFSITINGLDNTAFSYNAATYCIADIDPTPTVTGLPGGTFTSTPGLIINASTGEIDVSASTLGDYVVTYATTGTCANSSTFSITLTGLDNTSFNYDAATYCSNDSDPMPTITGLTGGTFISTAGLSINSSTGVIDVSASSAGMYTVTYATTGTCSDSSNNIVEIITVDNSVVEVGGVLSANQAGATYQWYQCPNTLLNGETNQNFSPLSSGDYKVVVTLGSCNIESNCITITTLGLETFEAKPQFSMYPNPSSNYVKIKSTIDGDFKIVNLLGQTIRVFKLKANVETTINTSSISDGMYLVMPTDDSNLGSKKLVIKSSI